MPRFYIICSVLLFLVMLPCAAQEPFWQPAGLPGGSFEDLVLDSSGNLYASSAGYHDLFESKDNGATWTARSFAFSSYHTTTVAQGSTLFAANRRTSGGKEGVVARSTDGGESWKTLATLPGSITRMAALPSGELLAATDSNGLHLSLDSGKTWRPATNPDTNITTIAAGRDRVVTVGNERLAISADAGRTWERVSPPGRSVRGAAITPDGTIYIFIGLGSDWQLLRSTDNAATWQYLPSYRDGDERAVIGVAPDGSILVAVHHFDSDNLYGHIARLAAGGTEWSKVPSIEGVAGTFITSFSGEMFASTGIGVYRSRDNGATWELLPLSADSPRNFVVAADGRLLTIPWSEVYVRLGSTVHASSDGGRHWTAIDTLDSPIFSLHPAPRGPIFAETGPSSIGRSMSPSHKFEELWVDDFEPGRWNEISSIGVDRTGNVYVVEAGVDGVLRMLVSTDNGESWTGRIELPEPYFSPGYVSITGPVFGYNGEIVLGYFSSETYGVLYVSTDNGATWTISEEEYNNPDILMYHSRGDLFVGHTYGGVLRRTADGRQASTVVSEHAGAMVIAPGGDLIALRYASTGFGIYRSSDLGATWRMLDVTPVSGRVTSLVIDSTGRLYGATRGLGIMRGPSLVADVDLPVRSVGNDGALKMIAMPQPAIDRMTLSFTLDRVQPLRLEIFDPTGSRIATLLDGTSAAGSHAVAWNTGEVAPGVYLVRAISGGGVSHMKVVVAR